MYAGSIIKIKMQKLHAFYRVQLNVLMHARRSYVLLATFHPRQRGIAGQVTRPTCAHVYVQVRGNHKVEWQ